MLMPKRLMSSLLRPSRLSCKEFSVLVSSHNVKNDDNSESPFLNRVKVGKHQYYVDEPENVGGSDAGPAPYDLLLGSLGACTSMTIRMYATMKKLPLDGVTVELSHSKVYASDCKACVGDDEKAKKNAKIDVIERHITLHGDKLTAKDREKLLSIANRCPVHRTLESSSVIETKLTETDPCDGGYDLPVFSHFVPSKMQQLTPDFTVRRLIPQVAKRAVGPFIFFDHFGPVEASKDTAMNVGPHPHINLATLTYLYDGCIIHRDSTGVTDAPIFPKQTNLMIAGKGVVHSERGVDALDRYPSDNKKLEGIQMWLGLPKELEEKQIDPSFHHAETLPNVSEKLQCKGKVDATLVYGEFGTDRVEQVPMLWPGMYLDLEMEAGSSVLVPIPKGHELCGYVARGGIQVGSDVQLELGESAIFNNIEDPKDNMKLRINATGNARVALFGGLPFPERKHMFWNFVASTKDEISKAAEDWLHLDRSRFPPVAGEPNNDSIPLPGKQFK